MTTTCEVHSKKTSCGCPLDRADRLFASIGAGWAKASSDERRELLEQIVNLAKENVDGSVGDRALSLVWNLAHSRDIPADLLEQILQAHVNILDISADRTDLSRKKRWLDRCVEEIKTNKGWVIPALKLTRMICCLKPERSPDCSSSTNADRYNRPEINNELQHKHALVIVVVDNLKSYMDEVRLASLEIKEGDPAKFFPDGRFNHTEQIQERLDILLFLLCDGQLWLSTEQAIQIWRCLAETAVYAQDREVCFKWFSELMGKNTNLDPQGHRAFFGSHVLQMDPNLMTESGITCFDRFFNAVNSKDAELIGLDYMLRLICCGRKEISGSSIDFLKEAVAQIQKSQDLRGIRDILECPICTLVPYSPVQLLQCQDGHVVCSTCKAHLTECPQCRAPFDTDIVIRNRKMEEVIERFKARQMF